MRIRLGLGLVIPLASPLDLAILGAVAEANWIVTSGGALEVQHVGHTIGGDMQGTQ